MKQRARIAKLARRIAAYEAIPAERRRGFIKPGSFKK